MAPCDPCPEYIKEAVRRPVRKSLAQVRAIKKLTNIVNEATNTFVGDVTDAITAVVDAIPDPPVFDLSEIVGLVTCPLTPIAIAIDPSLIANLDPRELYKRVQAQLKAYLQRIRADYENALRELEEWNVVRVLKQFLEDLKRLEFDEEDFIAAAAITAYVSGVCPEEYSEGPYEDFDNEAFGWSISGLIPSGMDSNVNAVMSELGRAETKFAAWRALSVAPVPF